jgi:protein phosphatase
VPDHHVGVPVLCGACRRSFSVRSPLAAPPGGSGPPRLDIAGATSAGRVRDRNEDGFLVQQLTWSSHHERRDAALVVVADGLGGHRAGEEASALLIRAVGGTLLPLLSGAPDGRLQDATPGALAEAVASAIQEANRVIYQRGKKEGGKGMGATAAVLLVWDGVALVGHVGDCRVYHVCRGQVTQVTRDQTLVARMVDLGQLTPEEALTHPARNDVIQAIGNHAEVKPARHEVRLAAGDWLLAASDGLHAHVEAGALAEACRSSPAAALLAPRLVDLADARGGSDNCTVVAVRCY